VSKKKLDSKEIQIAHDFAVSYEKCINSCRDAIKFYEDTDKYLFALEEETKSKRPFKIFKKSYKKWEDLINLIHAQQNENNKRYMDSLKDLEELIDIRLDLKMNN
jgi:hypothetical protein